MSVPELTTTTGRYLFASTWAPRDDSAWGMDVPGAKVPGLDTAANLLEIAVWSLREQELVEVQQLRPVETERLLTMGGHSFVRVRALDEQRELPGLEGSLLSKVRERPEEGFLGRFDDALARLLSGDDEKGLRGLVLALNLDDGAPWTSVANHCRDEARDAGMIELEGRLRRRPVIADPAAFEELRARDSEIAAARAEYRQKEAELDEAVISDCAAAVSWAHQS